MRCVGVVLAAGAGRRMGLPKALLHHADGTPWVRAAADVLAAGGCSPVLVVVGARAAEAEALVGPGAVAVRCDGWEQGMGASLRRGLEAVAALDPAPDAVLVGLVDTPGVTAAVVARLVAVAGPDVLARAAFDGVPGHPVLLGRVHWQPVATTVSGDAGARGYLRGRDDVLLVECGDVGHGDDLDAPQDVPGAPA